MIKKTNQTGFTVIELLIASAVFSVVLLLCMTAIIQVGRMYHRGTLIAKTQETARSILDEVTQAIQVSGGVIQPTPAIIPANNLYHFCVDKNYYSVLRAQQVVDGTPSGTQTRQALVLGQEDTCPSSPIDLLDQSLMLPNGYSSLVPSRMRISKLRVTQVPGTIGLYQVSVRVVSGEDDLLNNPGGEDASCRSGVGSHFCAVSELSTTVQRRVQ